MEMNVSLFLALYQVGQRTTQRKQLPQVINTVFLLYMLNGMYPFICSFVVLVLLLFLFYLNPS